MGGTNFAGTRTRCVPVAESSEDAARRLAEEIEKLRVIVRNGGHTERFKYGYDCAMRDALAAIRSLLEE